MKHSNPNLLILTWFILCHGLSLAHSFKTGIGCGAGNEISTINQVSDRDCSFTMDEHNLESKIPWRSLIWADWAPWTDCSLFCRGGHRVRRAACSFNPQGAIQNCNGEDIQYCHNSQCALQIGGDSDLSTTATTQLIVTASTTLVATTKSNVTTITTREIETTDTLSETGTSEASVFSTSAETAPEAPPATTTTEINSHPTCNSTCNRGQKYIAFPVPVSAIDAYKKCKEFDGLLPWVNEDDDVSALNQFILDSVDQQSCINNRRIWLSIVWNYKANRMDYYGSDQKFENSRLNVGGKQSLFATSMHFEADPSGPSLQWESYRNKNVIICQLPC